VTYMKSAIRDGVDLLTTNPTWALDFAPNGTRVGLGDMMTRKRLADTLETIAEQGPDAFYSGPIAETMINSLQAQNGTMTLEDLSNYTVAIRDIAQINYRGYTVTSTTAPSSGVVLLSILKILEGYKDFFTTENALNLSTHRMDEAMRFGYGQVRGAPPLSLYRYLSLSQRSELGDPLFVEGMDEYQKNMLAESTVAEIRSKISDTHTLDVSAYDPAGLENLDT
jgi:Gamma-glutamyltransferase